jgi:hypothetical protein
VVEPAAENGLQPLRAPAKAVTPHALFEFTSLHRRVYEASVRGSTGRIAISFISNGKEGTKGFFAHLERVQPVTLWRCRKAMHAQCSMPR